METLNQKFPSEAQMNGRKRTFNQDNYFANIDIDEARKKYLQFSVLMEYLNTVLGLGRHASMDEFATRIRDLVVAAHREDDIESAQIPTKEELESEDPQI